LRWDGGKVGMSRGACGSHVQASGHATFRMHVMPVVVPRQFGRLAFLVL
jgi:hypothetical protein